MRYGNDTRHREEEEEGFSTKDGARKARPQKSDARQGGTAQGSKADRSPQGHAAQSSQAKARAAQGFAEAGAP
jgi:hypothetical protein